MDWDKWRRSTSVEDYRDTKKPLDPAGADLAAFYESINEMIRITNSDLAKDAGSTSVKAHGG